MEEATVTLVEVVATAKAMVAAVDTRGEVAAMEEATKEGADPTNEYADAAIAH